MKSVAVLSLLIAVSLATKEVKDESPMTCDTTFCAKGQECVEDKNGAYCDCVKRCREPPSAVCGTDSKTYVNECELHKKACETNQEIEVAARMSCKEEAEVISEALDSMKSKDMPRPVVCLEKDRNSIRKATIDWLKAQELELAIEKISYKGLLKQYFDILDEDADGTLDTMEFMKLLERNETITEALSADAESNPILRGLCVDALIEITDEDSDFKLAFEEFHKCLDPDFQPPHQKCSLEGVNFEDGQEVPMSCNTCKCACGHWICTTLTCEDTVEDKDIEEVEESEDEAADDVRAAMEKEMMEDDDDDDDDDMEDDYEF